MVLLAGSLPAYSKTTFCATQIHQAFGNRFPDHFKSLEDMQLELERLEQMQPHEILRIARGATNDQRKDAYRALVKVYHPDRYQGRPPEQIEILNKLFKQLVEADDAFKSNQNVSGPVQDEAELRREAEEARQRAADRKASQERRLARYRNQLDQIPIQDLTARGLREALLQVVLESQHRVELNGVLTDFLSENSEQILSSILRETDFSEAAAMIVISSVVRSGPSTAILRPQGESFIKFSNDIHEDGMIALEHLKGLVRGPADYVIFRHIFWKSRSRVNQGPHAQLDHGADQVLEDFHESSQIVRWYDEQVEMDFSALVSDYAKKVNVPDMIAARDLIEAMGDMHLQLGLPIPERYQKDIQDKPRFKRIAREIFGREALEIFGVKPSTLERVLDFFPTRPAPAAVGETISPADQVRSLLETNPATREDWARMQEMLPRLLEFKRLSNRDLAEVLFRDYGIVLYVNRRGRLLSEAEVPGYQEAKAYYIDQLSGDARGAYIAPGSIAGRPFQDRPVIILGSNSPEIRLHEILHALLDQEGRYADPQNLLSSADRERLQNPIYRDHQKILEELLIFSFLQLHRDQLRINLPINEGSLRAYAEDAFKNLRRLAAERMARQRGTERLVGFEGLSDQDIADLHVEASAIDRLFRSVVSIYDLDA